MHPRIRDRYLDNARARQYFLAECTSNNIDELVDILSKNLSELTLLYEDTGDDIALKLIHAWLSLKKLLIICDRDDFDDVKAVMGLSNTICGLTAHTLRHCAANHAVPSRNGE